METDQELTTDRLQRELAEMKAFYEAREAEHLRDIIRLTEQVHDLVTEAKRNRMPDGGKGRREGNGHQP